jgi:hypothetical protein
MLNAGKDLASVLQALEVSESSYLRWRNQDGGMRARLHINAGCSLQTDERNDSPVDFAAMRAKIATTRCRTSWLFHRTQRVIVAKDDQGNSLNAISASVDWQLQR